MLRTALICDKAGHCAALCLWADRVCHPLFSYQIFRLIKRGMGSSTCASVTFKKSPGVKYGFVSLTKASVRKSVQTTQGLSVEDVLHTRRLKKDISNSKCVDYSGISKINRLVHLIDNTRGCPQITKRTASSSCWILTQAMTAVSISF